MNFRAVLALAAALCLPVFSTDAATALTVQRMLSLFEQLRQAEAAKTSGKVPNRIRFDLPQSEVNAYLSESLRTTPRPGVKSMTVKFFPSNYVSTFTMVDFDEVERMRPGLIPKMLRPVLSGTKSIWVDVRFKTQNSAATFDIEKAYFNNVPLPAVVVQKVVETVAARQPEHYDTSKPIPLPFGLRNVWTQAGVFAGEN